MRIFMRSIKLIAGTTIVTILRSLYFMSVFLSLQMLTGDIRPTSGEAFMNEYSICRQMNLVRKHIGYCPQFDALDTHLTAREHLHFYARIRGIPESEIGKVRKPN